MRYLKVGRQNLIRQYKVHRYENTLRLRPVLYQPTYNVFTHTYIEDRFRVEVNHVQRLINLGLIFIQEE